MKKTIFEFINAMITSFIRRDYQSLQSDDIYLGGIAFRCTEMTDFCIPKTGGYNILLSADNNPYDIKHSSFKLAVIPNDDLYSTEYYGIINIPSRYRKSVLGYKDTICVITEDS